MNGNEQMIDLMAKYLSKEDVYAGQAIASISAFVLKERTKLGMSQTKFAKKMGVTQGMVSKWESAEYNFTLETIAQICAKLGYSFDISFMNENEYKKASDLSSYTNLKPVQRRDHSDNRKRTSIQIAA